MPALRTEPLRGLSVRAFLALILAEIRELYRADAVPWVVGYSEVLYPVTVVAGVGERGRGRAQWPAAHGPASVDRSRHAGGQDVFVDGGVGERGRQAGAVGGHRLPGHARVENLSQSRHAALDAFRHCG